MESYLSFSFWIKSPKEIVEFDWIHQPKLYVIYLCACSVPCVRWLCICITCKIQYAMYVLLTFSFMSPPDMKWNEFSMFRHKSANPHPTRMQYFSFSDSDMNIKYNNWIRSLLELPQSLNLIRWQKQCQI